jgi:hypothetical protein
MEKFVDAFIDTVSDRLALLCESVRTQIPLLENTFVLLLTEVHYTKRRIL